MFRHDPITAAEMGGGTVPAHRVLAATALRASRTAPSTEGACTGLDGNEQVTPGHVRVGVSERRGTRGRGVGGDGRRGAPVRGYGRPARDGSGRSLLHPIYGHLLPEPEGRLRPHCACV